MGKLYGLIGYPLDHSWSKKYFEKKFESEGLNGFNYKLFPVHLSKDLILLVQNNPGLAGLNVTIPHKQTVIKYLNVIEASASEIGAVNCIRIVRVDNEITMMGYNTDTYGFEMAIKPLLMPHHSRALILGTGGSANAVAWVLKKLGIEFMFVSRRPYDCNQVSYNFLSTENIKAFPLIINATPVGMYPNISFVPQMAYEALTSDHLLFDLIYNPTESGFLMSGKKYGAQISNGLSMLEFQAEKSWEIWEPNLDHK
ncbi:MAG TPA: shikimate dehydrogenase [Bacteroidales bacterium]|nr:shikimate dehydrogenase [Bacteroidales bacterium]HRX95637.1 shikimate dehydrogenase [Bacteroidales bacterium]